MKTKIATLILVSILLASCAPETPTQESQVDVVEIATEAPATEVPVAEEPATTEEPIAIEPLTETPTEAPIACVTLLTPINGVEIPPVGKVTFSWTAMDEAGKYVLNIILPSGEVVPFETDQTFRDRYMEAFVTGGEYQWQVVAQGTDGSEICVSGVATFNKPTYQTPKSSGGDGGSGNENGAPPPPSTGGPGN
jgi:hypothetical protein